jgi:hypothetical protein
MLDDLAKRAGLSAYMQEVITKAKTEICDSGYRDNYLSDAILELDSKN